ncbi:hypothetical protein [Arthrobacter sp. UYCo732]|uniref:hypothetical protein n=1 Tax=Arthrobacter sp. UYCo732 TaxID=3156336 RepID=UPI00339296EE
MPSSHLPQTQQARTFKPGWADAGLARERLALLLDAGLTMEAVADLCAVPVSQMYVIRSGRRGKPMAKIRQVTLNALLAIRSKDIAAYDLPAGSKVRGDDARRQLQFLYCLGWSVDALHERSGLAKSALRGLRDGDGTTEGFRHKVDALYRTLRGQEAPRVTGIDRTRSDNALARAAAQGWSADDEELAA